MVLHLRWAAETRLGVIIWHNIHAVLGHWLQALVHADEVDLSVEMALGVAHVHPRKVPQVVFEQQTEFL